MGGSRPNSRSVLLVVIALVLSCSSVDVLLSGLNVVAASCGSVDVGGAMTCRSLLQAADTVQAVQQEVGNLGNITVAVPAEIAVPAGSRLLGSLRAVGHQHYSYNGSAWVLYNATAWLYVESASRNASGQQVNNYMPVVNMGREAVVGVHFFLAQADVEGGQPSWQLGTSRVTAKGVAASSVDSDSITWNLLQATSFQLIVSDSSSSSGADINWVGDVRFVQRLDTQRGLPPSSSAASVQVGDTFSSVYAALYAFYA